MRLSYEYVWYAKIYDNMFAYHEEKQQIAHIISRLKNKPTSNDNIDQKKTFQLVLPIFRTEKETDFQPTTAMTPVVLSEYS